MKNVCCCAVVVAQLAEWLLPNPKVRSSISVIGKFLYIPRTFIYYQKYCKIENKEKEAGKWTL